MPIIFESFFGVGFFLLIGLVLFWVFGSLLTRTETDTSLQRLRERHYMAQHQRAQEKIKILETARGMPNCPDGTFSDPKQAMHDKYLRLDVIDKQLTRQETNEIIELEGYLPDEIAEIIQGKRS